MPEMLTEDRVRPIHKSDENKLKTILRLKDTDDLPPSIVDAYWQHARPWQLLGYTALADVLLVGVVVQGRATAPAPTFVPWVIQAAKDKQLKHGDTIKVSLAGVERKAKFIKVVQDNERVRVHVEGDADERLMPIQNVLGAA